MRPLLSVLIGVFFAMHSHLLLGDEAAEIEVTKVPTAMSPMDFLLSLKKSSKTLTLYERTKGWVKLKDVVELLELVGDETPCRSANWNLSAGYTRRNSTIGVEARKLILGYCYGEYPTQYSNGPELPFLEVQLMKRFKLEVSEKFKIPVSEDEKKQKQASEKREE